MHIKALGQLIARAEPSHLAGLDLNDHHLEEGSDSPEDTQSESEGEPFHIALSSCAFSCQ